MKVELEGKKKENEVSYEVSKNIDSSLKDKDEKDKENITHLILESLKYRVNLLKSSLTFPYWIYSKGAASPLTANQKSPWLKVFEDKNKVLFQNLWVKSWRKGQIIL